MEEKPLVNRVASSGLITINLEEYYPDGPITKFDLKDFLYMELILKEKDFREALKSHDWTKYQDHNLLVYCSADAIIPVWAYMLVASYAQPYAHRVFQGDEASFLRFHYLELIKNMDTGLYQDKRIVIKGCSKRPVPTTAYASLTAKLKPFVLSIMYGEPCSTVPIYKRPRN